MLAKKSPQDPDLELVLLATGKEHNPRQQEEALVALYNKYFKLIYGYFYNKTGNHTTTEDLTSETFLQFTKDLGKFQQRSSFKNWLFGIAKFILLAHLREKYQTPSELDENQAIAKFDLEEPQDNKHESILQKILEQLSPKYSQVLDLRFLQGYTIAETATELGLTPQNIKVLQHRALKKANKLANL